MAEEEEEGEGEEEAMALDFDALCAAVALQTRGFSADKTGSGETGVEEGETEFGGGGVQRMWEGDVLDCFDDRRIAIEAACCPCYRFGKNMRRANLGPCFLQNQHMKHGYHNIIIIKKPFSQPIWGRLCGSFFVMHSDPKYKSMDVKHGTIYFVLMILVVLSYIAFLVTKRHWFLLMGVVSTISFGVYTGYFRTRIRRQFNIRGSGGSGSLIILDDCISHQICPCCTLCQESRTLEMNNVQDGVWHGRGDTICIGSFGEGNKELSALHKPSSSVPTKSPELCSMERASNGSEDSWNVNISHSEPLVKSA